ncbi:MAG: molybdopterin molybdotransferase MoeA [Deltaproteobacteria bacterium]|nr:molybdopterin molybdotransferase MoeA [Deltaproteobacteria bacterium]
MKQSISVDEAREIILGAVSPMGSEKVPLQEGLGRVLAETVSAPWDVPPLDNSAMDGYAVKAADVAAATRQSAVRLAVLEDIPAGRLPTRAVKTGTASRIMTGAALPAGADAVVRVEDTEKSGGEVLVLVPVEPGLNIRRAGEDVTAGQKVIEAGTPLTAAALGMLASLGRAAIEVTQRPRVAILSTGDELVDVDGDRSGGKIIASNTYSLSAQAREAGAVPLTLPIAPDRPEIIEARFREAMHADVILSSGGVSVGDFDFVKDVLRRLGSEMKFWRVAMKPGHPLAFGILGGKPVFGLPGNPVSCMVSFEQFVRPALLKMMGHHDLFRPVVRARLREALRQKPGRRTFVRAVVSRDGDSLSVASTGSQSSGVLLSMLRANGLIIFPEDRAELPEGAEVEVQIIDPAFWSQSGPGA